MPQTNQTRRNKRGTARSRRRHVTESPPPNRKRTKVRRQQPQEFDTYIKIFRKILNFLTPSPAHSRLEHRKDEREELMEFIEGNLRQRNRNRDDRNKPSVMIIFGQAGLGKTLLLMDIMHNLNTPQRGREGRQIRTRKKVSSFYFNSMNYDHPQALLISILKQLFKEKVKVDSSNGPNYYLQLFKKHARELLKSKSIVVMIDELEYLYKRRPNEFYIVIEFFDIVLKGFIKIGISNTLTFISKVSKLKLMLQLRFMVFKPYSIEQIEDILETRVNKALRGSGTRLEHVISKKAIGLLARKVSACDNGDIRYLLVHFIRVVENKVRELIRLKRDKSDFDMRKVQLLPIEMVRFLKEATGSEESRFQLIERLGAVQQIFLLTLHRSKQNGLDYDFKSVFKTFLELLELFGHDTRVEFKGAFDCLESYKLVKFVKIGRRLAKVRLEINRKRLRDLLSKIDYMKDYLN